MGWLGAGDGKHKVPSLFWSSKLVWKKREGPPEAVEVFRVFVLLDKCTLFSYIFLAMNLEVEALYWPGFCSLLHLPYILPLFMWWPSCSALMRGHLKLLGLAEGDWPIRYFSSSANHNWQLLNQTCKLTLLLPLHNPFFSVWFPWQWLIRVYILEKCWI